MAGRALLVDVTEIAVDDYSPDFGTVVEVNEDTQAHTIEVKFRLGTVKTFNAEDQIEMQTGTGGRFGRG